MIAERRGLHSVTAHPNKANWRRLPTWAYAVVPIAPTVPVPAMPVVAIVITDMVMTVMVVIAPMILVMIVVLRIALISLVLVMVIIAFASEGRYGKHQNTCYCTNEGEFANHLVVLCH